MIPIYLNALMGLSIVSAFIWTIASFCFAGLVRAKSYGICQSRMLYGVCSAKLRQCSLVVMTNVALTTNHAPKSFLI